jgi:hypothetical protein
MIMLFKRIADEIKLEWTSFERADLVFGSPSVPRAILAHPAGNRRWLARTTDLRLEEVRSSSYELRDDDAEMTYVYDLKSDSLSICRVYPYWFLRNKAKLALLCGKNGNVTLFDILYDAYHRTDAECVSRIDTYAKLKNNQLFSPPLYTFDS